MFFSYRFDDSAKRISCPSNRDHLRKTTKVFIGCSQETSNDTAIALANWLDEFFGSDFSTWTFKRDQTPGRSWSNVLEEQLRIADAGIFCVTKDNINNNWMEREITGIRSNERNQAKKDGNPIFPFLIGFNISDEGIDADWRSDLKKYNVTHASAEAEVKQMVSTINDLLERPYPPPTFEAKFTRLWNKLSTNLANAAQKSAPQKSDTTKQPDPPKRWDLLTPEYEILWRMLKNGDPDGGFFTNFNDIDWLRSKKAMSYTEILLSLKTLILQGLVEEKNDSCRPGGYSLTTEGEKAAREYRDLKNRYSRCD